MVPVLVFPDGRRVALDADIVVGRAPVAPDESPTARSISVSVPTVSKTHALIGSDASGVWLIDLHSSNGSEALDSLGVSQRALPGQRLSLPAGSHIRIGTDTIITIDAGDSADDGDDDRTVTIQPIPPATPPSASPPSASPPAPPPAENPVDWSTVADAAPVAAAADPVAAAPQPQPAQPPPVAPAPALPATEPQSAAPATEAFNPVPPVAVPPNPAAPAFEPAPGPAYGAAPASAPPAASPSPGRSTAHLIGTLVLVAWSAIGFADLRRWVPDAIIDALDGRIISFFVVPDRDTIEFAEYYSFASLPDPLSFLARGADIGPIVAIVVGLVALAVPRAAVRWSLVGLVVIPVVLLVGLLVTFGVDSFDFFTDEIDRFIQWFVLPALGSLLVLLPRRRSNSAPTTSQDVFYAPSQAPGPPPSAGPGAPPFS